MVVVIAVLLFAACAKNNPPAHAQNELPAHAENDPPVTGGMQRMEAEVTVRSTDAGSTCKLSGRLHVPRQSTQEITGEKWRGTAESLRGGDVVVVHASVGGAETWACEAECSLKVVGANDNMKSRVFAQEKRPGPTCPASPSLDVTCILHVPQK